MTPREFEAALAEATQGIVRSGTGAGEELSAALDAVAADGPDPRQELIDAAREAYKRQRQRERK
jgi:Flp pilus assembly protein TadB